MSHFFATPLSAQARRVSFVVSSARARLDRADSALNAATLAVVRASRNDGKETIAALNAEKAYCFREVVSARAAHGALLRFPPLPRVIQ